MYNFIYCSFLDYMQHKLLVNKYNSTHDFFLPKTHLASLCKESDAR
jgi:hypothetical protein